MIQREHQVANPERTQIELSDEVKAIDLRITESPDNAALWMERGLALADMKLMREAVEAFSKSASLDPFCGIVYRHRAHRHLSCWEIQEACSDFALASRLIPDNWDVWYHLALSHHLLGEYGKALKAYKVCYSMSHTDNIIPVTNWYWATFMRLGREEEAAKILEPIDQNMSYPEGRNAYFSLLSLYKGWLSPQEVEEEAENRDELNKFTRLYGIANYYYFRGDLNNYDRVIDRILQEGADDCNCWPTFGYIAAMVDKKTRRNV